MKTGTENMKFVDAMNSELKKAVKQVNQFREKVNHAIKDQDWFEDVKCFAMKQRQQVQKRFGADISRFKVFLERERKEIENFQKKIPGEVRKFKQILVGQRREIENIILKLKRVSAKRLNTAAVGAKNTKSKGQKPKSVAQKNTKSLGSRKKIKESVGRSSSRHL